MTDHKPLVGLADKPEHLVSPRLTRLVDRLRHFDLQWEYLPGKTNFLPDFLSRMPNLPKVDEVVDMDEDVREMLKFPLFQNIAQNKDAVVDTVRHFQQTQWPNTFRDLPADVKFLWPFRDTIRVEENMLMDGENRVYVPEKSRGQVLQELHEGHPGEIYFHKRVLKQFFWKGVRADASQWVKNCFECARLHPQNKRAPLLPRKILPKPGAIVASDFFEIDRKMYLVFYDVFSQFPYVFDVPRADVQSLIKCALQFFQWTGCPCEFWSDNGECTWRKNFKIYWLSWEFRLLLVRVNTRSPTGLQKRRSN